MAMETLEAETRDERMEIPTPDEVERVLAFLNARPPFTNWVKTHGDSQ